MRITNNQLLTVALSYDSAKRWYNRHEKGNLDKAWNELTNRRLVSWFISLGDRGFEEHNLCERCFWYLRAAIELATKYISPFHKNGRLLINWIDKIDFNKELTDKRLEAIKDFIDPNVYNAIQAYRGELYETCLSFCVRYLATFSKKEDIEIIKNNITWFPLSKE